MRSLDTSRRELDRKLEAIAWALFLIMVGCLWLIPPTQVPSGAWLIGLGVIMIGLNVARHINNIRVSSFTILLGIIALLLGLSELMGFALPALPTILILLGCYIIFRVYTSVRRIQ